MGRRITGDERLRTFIDSPVALTLLTLGILLSGIMALRVESNPQLLNKYGIGVESVRMALANANTNKPKGMVEDGDRSWPTSRTQPSALPTSRYRSRSISIVRASRAASRSSPRKPLPTTTGARR